MLKYAENRVVAIAYECQHTVEIAFVYGIHRFCRIFQVFYLVVVCGIVDGYNLGQSLVRIHNHAIYVCRIDTKFVHSVDAVGIDCVVGSIVYRVEMIGVRCVLVVGVYRVKGVRKNGVEMVGVQCVLVVC